MLLVPATAAERIRAGGRWGKIVCSVSPAEELAAITRLSVENGAIIPVDLPDKHWVKSADETPNGRWYRVPSTLHGAWLQAVRREGAGVPIAAFKELIPTALIIGTHIAVTYAPDVENDYPGVGLPDLLAWYVTNEGAMPMGVEVMPDALGMSQLRGNWPVEALSAATVMVVGVGSIGGAATLDLASYGVGRLLLVDPDRLRWHNLVRHVSSVRDVGRLKVTALREQITAVRPDTRVEAHGLDVVSDADAVRSMLAQTNAVLCAADGVGPRRVVSHLARQARIDAILACVLEDGAIGEVLRLRPWPGRGCLLCHRRHLRESGGIDPEPMLEAGYGSFTRPMAAVGGDLHHVASLAAKVTVASLLERAGHSDQQLAGEHAVIGLRPRETWAEPFNVERTGEIQWAGPWPSQPDCVTCGGS